MTTFRNTVSSNNATTAIGGVAPSAADTVYYNRGADEYNAGMDFANDLTLFHITSGFRGSFGKDGTQLGVLSTAGKIIIEFGGELVNLKNNGTNARIEGRPTRGGRVNLHNNTVTLLIWSAGPCWVYDTCDANEVRANGSAQIYLMKHASTTTNTAVARDRSTIAAERPVTNVEIYDQATFIARETCAPTVAAKGGKYIHEGSAAPTLGDCANCTLDFSGVREAMTILGTPTFDDGVVIIIPADPALITLPTITSRGRKHEIRVAG